MPPEVWDALKDFFRQLPYVLVILVIVFAFLRRQDQREAVKDAQIAAEREKRAGAVEAERQRQEAREAKRDEEYQRRIIEQRQQFAEMLADQARRFSASLAEQGQKFSEGMARIAEEVKENTRHVTVLSAMTQTHDSRMDKVAGEVVERVIGRMRDLPPGFDR